MLHKKHSSRILLCIVLGIVFVLVFLFVTGRYPIAIVNGHSISSKKFHTASVAALFYYTNILNAYDTATKNTDAKGVDKSEIETGVLTNLIEDKLIEAKLSVDIGKELPYLINEKLATIVESSDIKKAAATLYGMNWEDFKQSILVSQAMREILADTLFLKKEKLDDWLAQEKKSARVMIFSNTFAWDGSKVIKR